MSSVAASVVITCFNLARYIESAINSVLEQDFTGSFEIVVVDDCSTDDSAELIRRFEGVRYISTDANSGVLLAMLKGVEAAREDLIFFVDGDDLWEPTKLRKACGRFEADPQLGLLTHDLAYIDAHGRALRRVSRPSQMLSGMNETDGGEAVRRGILELGDYVWLGSALAVRRSVIHFDRFAAWARSLPDPENTYQDWPLAYWAAALPEARMAYVPEKLFRYRLHNRNHSGDASTAGKAMRNFRRAYNTSIAMLDVARNARLPRGIQRQVARQAAYNHYLVSLYAGKRLAAAGDFIRALGYLRRNPGRIPKELVRFAGIQILGADRFTRLLAKRKG